MSGTLRSRWRYIVAATGVVTPTVKVTLLMLADDMKENGYVSVPLDRMTRRVGKAERRVLDHYAAAVNAGLLARVSRGYDGHTAVYRAVIPERRA